MGDFYFLARNHRSHGDERVCNACQSWRKNVARAEFQVDNKNYFLWLCGGCLRAGLEVAVGGRKPERP